MKICGFAAIIGLLVLAGCAAPGTIESVEDIAPDGTVVFGTVEVWSDGEQETWGTKWTGHNNFYLTILPSDSNEAFTHLVEKDGTFYWSLPPGDYMILGYHWQHLQTQRWGDLRATFTVPESGPDAYLGSLILQGNEVAMATSLVDKFDQVVSIYDTRFPRRKGTAVKRLIEPVERLGNFKATSGQCYEGWNIECTKRYRGVTPTTPAVSQSGFTTIDTLTPEFRWKGCGRADVKYDFVLYEAAVFGISGSLKSQYARGHVAAYAEALDEPRWQPDVALKPDTRYYWSVRLRDGDTVSRWSTVSHTTFLLVYMSSGHGQWFRFKTG